MTKTTISVLTPLNKEGTSINVVVGEDNIIEGYSFDGIKAALIHNIGHLMGFVEWMRGQTMLSFDNEAYVYPWDWDRFWTNHL